MAATSSDSGIRVLLRYSDCTAEKNTRSGGHVTLLVAHLLTNTFIVPIDRNEGRAALRCSCNMEENCDQTADYTILQHSDLIISYVRCSLTYRASNACMQVPMWGPKRSSRRMLNRHVRPSTLYFHNGAWTILINT